MVFKLNGMVYGGKLSRMPIDALASDTVVSLLAALSDSVLLLYSGKNDDTLC